MQIDFYLRYRTKFGEQLYISGDLLSLGEGQVARALPMTFLNQEYWHASVVVHDAPSVHYKYILQNEKGERILEGEKDRVLVFKGLRQNHILLIDTWNYAGSYENALFSAPFKKLLGGRHIWYKAKRPKTATHLFKIKAPLLQKDEVVCLAGASEPLTNWSTTNPVLLERDGNWHSVQLDLSDTVFPAAYKYGIYNLKEKTFVQFELGDNRLLHAEHLNGALTVLHDGFLQVARKWRGSGVAVPVFSLRTANSFGVGEFLDLKMLTDWAATTGFNLIQLLPVNDTSATFAAHDSYPYAAISAFALHPIYINLHAVAGKKYASAIRSLQKKQKQLNALPELDYDQVIHYKMNTLRELFELQGDEFLKEKGYSNFVAQNKYWLQDYAVFCHLRDKWGTADFRSWKTNAVYNSSEVEKLANGKTKTAREILFYYFIQYHLHLQLKEAVEYAHKKGIVLKGDIPIGIYRNSVDAWVSPDLYHMCWQAGAPPDDFAVKGQNWGFPTYNWQRMQEDGFAWWRARFEQMSNYFDAFRIDHILGFFRIWSIPLHAVEGIMGRFVPALPTYVNELGERGIWFDYDRFCKPYITEQIIQNTFGVHAGFVKENFLSFEEKPGRFSLKEEYSTQRKVEEYFGAEDDEANDGIKKGLFDLISNVIFFEEEGSEKQAFHFRISVEQTSSFQHLDGESQSKLKELYIDYFYRRQDGFWEAEALRKLPHLKAATNMLVCGEDLGMVPHCVPGVMKDLGILSLEIQRMPKNPQTEFFHPKDAPYLSVITPSTHDMSTVRGWWEEDRVKTQRFYNTILEGGGEAPYFCESWVNRAIVLQHLYSPAMWSIFGLQDVLGMSDLLRRQNPFEERINEPANPKHYWRYRMHITLEQLVKAKAFNDELKDYITNSGR